MSLLDCFKQPIFMKYKEEQPFNKNHLRPCPMLENPDALRKIVAETGAKSTDMQSPEDVDSLCSKCDPYAREWAIRAAKLWDDSLKAKETKKAQCH
jgi:heterodisulfide reductase subunit B